MLYTWYACCFITSSATWLQCFYLWFDTLRPRLRSTSHDAVGYVSLKSRLHFTVRHASICVHTVFHHACSSSCNSPRRSDLSHTCVTEHAFDRRPAPSPRVVIEVNTFNVDVDSHSSVHDDVYTFVRWLTCFDFDGFDLHSVVHRTALSEYGRQWKKIPTRHCVERVHHLRAPHTKK